MHCTIPWYQIVNKNNSRDIDLDKNKDFWNDIVIIVEDELQKLRRLDTKFVILLELEFGAIFFRFPDHADLQRLRDE